ncbi:D-2-hydroxyacid dehydrogenase family protein [Flavobacterium sp. LC2016-01]|uniref:D-2-hydroxyacid dehydrogenase family protein n=1 Tax=Flavobacterium sp. LC2016-01 TaxID=2675876 RepID=UPI0012BA91C2|nr:D-2-hydroxyacid dehydrogenase family protein [Flavobacterium sp. LC2016-01]MTH15822.1 D-2-hydroxyacid dehydrogenase family protein [Flavobacterium sp. LC2016-01]
MQSKINIAVLDDYQNVSQQFADWSTIKIHANVTVFNDTITDFKKLTERLQPFEVICVMRERTPLHKDLLKSLPNLKLIVSTGGRNASIDTQTAESLGIEIRNTGYLWSGAPEMTWALLMAAARQIPQESNNFSSGKWQTTIGTDLAGKTIGIIGLGNIGLKIASYAKAFDMNVIAWSENLTQEKAAAGGAKLVTKEELFRQSDFISIHLVLSDRSIGTIKREDLYQMKPTAYLINTSRGPLIDQDALVEILQEKKIAGAAIDVYNQEPLPANHPLRKLDNLLGTSHVGYVTENTYKIFYEDTVSAITDWMMQDNI